MYLPHLPHLPHLPDLSLFAPMIEASHNEPHLQHEDIGGAGGDLFSRPELV